METTGVKVCIIHWNEPDKLKIFDKDIVCLTAARQVERDWKWLRGKYNIKYWCFLSELIHD